LKKLVAELSLDKADRHRVPIIAELDAMFDQIQERL